MTKSFFEGIDPMARNPRLYSHLPSAFFKQNPSTNFHEIEDNLVWDKESPLHSVRFDPSLSLWKRCEKMYNAIIGTHYIETLYDSHKITQSTIDKRSFFYDFCLEKWNFCFLPDEISIVNAEIMPFFGAFNVEEYKIGDTLKDNTIYLKVNEDKKIHYTLNSSNGEFFPTRIKGDQLIKQTEIATRAKETNPNKKFFLLYNYDKINNTIMCKFLSSDNQIINHKINLNELNEMIENEPFVVSNQKYGHKWALNSGLYIYDQMQQSYQSGTLAVTSNLSGLNGEPITYSVNPAFQQCILGYLVKRGVINQVEHYVIDEKEIKGQKGLLDYLIFPLIARKISYDGNYYRDKKIESGFEYPIKFILYTPLSHILFLVYLLLEILRMLSGILLTLICAATVVPILHYQLNETGQSSSSHEQNNHTPKFEDTPCAPGMTP